MEHKNAKIESIRETFGISREGLPNEREALSWYKEHFRLAKGTDFEGSFGFRYLLPPRGDLEFDYRRTPDGFFIACPYPLDSDVPFDRVISILAEELKLPEWAAPALRLVVLIGELPNDLTLHIPNWLITPVGYYRLLFQPRQNLSLRQWRKMGEVFGVLPANQNSEWMPVPLQGYGRPRWGKKEMLYWQTLRAYMEVVGIRRQQGRKGKRGILQEAAQLLERKYGWEYAPDSYTVRRYLDRAERRWKPDVHWGR